MALSNGKDHQDTAARQADLAIDKARGRKDGDGTPAVIKTKPLKQAIAELVRLKEKSDEVKAKLKKAITSVAEQSGLLSSVVARFVSARAGGPDKFEAERSKAEQMDIAFREVGGDKKKPEKAEDKAE